jgi:hypothetical protein
MVSSEFKLQFKLKKELPYNRERLFARLTFIMQGKYRIFFFFLNKSKKTLILSLFKFDYLNYYLYLIFLFFNLYLERRLCLFLFLYNFLTINLRQEIIAKSLYL